MTSSERSSLANFIDKNKDLIDQGEFETVIRRCPVGIRSYLQDAIEKETGIRVEPTYKAYPGRELVKKLKEIVAPLCLGYYHFYNNKGKKVVTYKFYGVSGLKVSEDEAQRIIEEALDDLQVNYRYVAVDSYRTLDISVSVDINSVIY